jgi:formylglycine-generating enzyme required for sulfatase activity
VADDFQTASGLFIQDIDGDGDYDIVGATVYGNEIAWWRNDGLSYGSASIAWTKQTIDGDSAAAVYVYAADVDGDSDVDVLGAGAGEVAWWRNDGSDNTITWTKQIVAAGLEEATSVVAADLDGDGDIDVLGTDAASDRVIWWQNEGPVGDDPAWVEHLIADGFRYSQTLDAADLDGDGDFDVVAGSRHDNQVAWWRNDGGRPLAWTKQVIQTAFDWPHWVHVADIDGDGRLDVLGAAYWDNTVVWWRNCGTHSGADIDWKIHKIDGEFAGVLTVHSADLDNDGDLDVLGTANGASEISWWRNDGGQPIKWAKQELKAKTFGGAWGLHVGDLDADGDIDIVGGGSSEIRWWENTLMEPGFQAQLDAADCLAIGLPELACTGVSSNDTWMPVIQEFEGVPMVLVPAGCFMMGYEHNLAEEKPVHRVCITQPYWIDLTEVTVDQFAHFLDGQEPPVDSYDGWRDTASQIQPVPVQIARKDGYWAPLPGKDEYPVQSVTRAGAGAYCAWRGARLPSEAEWEYAARGPDNLLYPWGNELILENVVRIYDRAQVPKVGSKPQAASWTGAHDMSSSLYEWVNSIYRPYPYDASDGREVGLDVDNSSDRVLRGCPRYHGDGMTDNVSATARFSAPPGHAVWYFGFRCALSFEAASLAQ